MKRLLILTTSFLLLVSCAGATRDIKKEIADALQPSTLRYSFNTQPENLKVLSKCGTNDISVNIANVEKNNTDFNIVPRRQGTFMVNAQEISDHVVEYLKDAYRQCRISSNPNSKNIINISVQKLEGWYSYNCGATLRLNVALPEKNLTLSFVTTQSTLDIHNALAYAIHVISWQIVNDPTIQDYILCK